MRSSLRWLNLRRNITDRDFLISCLFMAPVNVNPAAAAVEDNSEPIKRAERLIFSLDGLQTTSSSADECGEFHMSLEDRASAYRAAKWRGR